MCADTGFEGGPHEVDIVDTFFLPVVGGFQRDVGDAVHSAFYRAVGVGCFTVQVPDRFSGLVAPDDAVGVFVIGAVVVYAASDIGVAAGSGCRLVVDNVTVDKTCIALGAYTGCTVVGGSCCTVVSDIYIHK